MMHQEDRIQARSSSPDGRLDETRRTARVLEIIQQIAVAPGRWSRRALAERHEVSERMIQKDLYLIRHRLGLELKHDGEGYEFAHLPKLPTLTYSFNEALAIITAVRIARMVPGANSTDLAAAVARLQSVFPPELQPLLHEATDRLPVEATHGRRHEMMSLLHRALVEGRQVWMVYATGSRDGEVKERIVEPYHIMPYSRSWYLVAHDSLRGAVLDFKLDRIREARLLDAIYAVPTDFDIDDYLGDNWGIMRDAGPPAEGVSLLFTSEVGRWMSEEQWHKSQQVEILPDGRVRVRFFVSVTPEMIRWLLFYGADVFVEQPVWLREQVREAHQAAVGGKS